MARSDACVSENGRGKARAQHGRIMRERRVCFCNSKLIRICRLGQRTESEEKEKCGEELDHLHLNKTAGSGH